MLLEIRKLIMYIRDKEGSRQTQIIRLGCKLASLLSSSVKWN